ncbi:hypothetical protein AAKU67_003868 [Oxalobacteraceae bacterium GrIS 2.11]
MSKMLSTYVKNFQFFPKSAIYDEDAKYRINKFNQSTATLYFIVRTKKARLQPSTFRLTGDHYFDGIIEVGDRQVPTRFSCVDMMFQYKELNEKFKSCENFFDYCMNQWGDKNRPDPEFFKLVVA